jgi:peptidoglycan/LPS O-acetylase OafA/YrhL
VGSEHATGTRLHALDGLRGLAVVAVLCFHAELTHASGGFLGVSAFFTLSGFLITTLLLRERQASGSVRLSAFWARRARRLLPAATVALAGVLLYGMTVATDDQLRNLRGDMLSAIAYVTNWHFYFDGQDYSKVFSAPSPVLHFWSLAIEEQFYLLFPIVVVLALRFGRGRRAALAVAGAALLTTSVAFTLAFSDDPTRVYYGTDTRTGELMVGVLLAVACSRWSAPATRAGRAVLSGAGVVALGMLLFWWATVHQQDHWLSRGGFVVHAVLVAIVIAAARFASPVASALSARPLVALGLISYGVYLYHWPVYLWLSPARVHTSYFALFALRLAVTITLAIVSYHLIEQPVRTGARIRGRWPRVLMPATGALLLVALLAVTASPPPPAFSLTPVAQHTPLTAPVTTPTPATKAVAGAPAPTPTTAPAGMHRALDTARPVRVMVVGDSVGITVGRGEELYANETGRVVVRNEARKWCSLARYAPRIMGYGESEQGEGCNDWATRWAADIDEFDPDVVVVVYTVWEIAARKPAGATDWLTPGEPAFHQWQLAEYQTAADVLSRRGASVVWTTIPCSPEDASTAGSPAWFVNRDTIHALARSRPATVRLIDLEAELCPGHMSVAAYRGVDPARPDGRHFSDVGALALAHWMMPIILGDAPPPRP